MAFGFTIHHQVVIVVDEIMWTGNLGTSILRVQQAGANAVKDEKALEGGLEALPRDGDVAAAGPSESAVQTFLDYSLEQIEAMIDLVRGDLDRWAYVVGSTGWYDMIFGTIGMFYVKMCCLE